MENKEKLIIIDGNSLIYRAFYALPLLTNLKGEYSNAIFGFANELVKIIAEFKPTHMVVCFDVSKHTFRTDLFDGYKATRKPMPEELASQLEPIKKMLGLMGIKILEKENFEADDIIGTVAKRSKISSLILTGDRDSFQLIDEKTSVCFMKRGISDFVIMTPENIKSEYGVLARQVVDLKALQGDSADNIPGVAGIGPKTAIELIEKYDNLDNIYANIYNISAKVSNKLSEQENMAKLSKQLATINTDVDISFNLDDFLLTFPFPRKLIEFFDYYNIRGLVKKEELFQNEEENIETKILTKTAKNIQEFKNLLDFYKNYDKIAVFCDEKNLHLSFGDCEIIAQTSIGNLTGFALKDCFFELEKIFKDSQKIIILRDAKAFFHYLDNAQILLPENYFDVSVATNACEGIVIKYLDDIFSFYGNDKNFPAYSLFADMIELEKKIKEMGVEDLIYNTEFKLVKTLFEMERRGFCVDKTMLVELETQYKKKIEVLLSQIKTQAQCDFNVNSPKQLAEVLYEKLHLPNLHKSSTSAEVLEELLGMHEIIPLLIEYRKASKFYGTYISALFDHIDADGKVRTNFNQSLTSTGRLSSNEPNLQNIPIRSDEGRQIRSLFVADKPDRVLVDADYSQIELRILADLSDDDFYITAFKNGEDIHTKTAQEVFGVDKNGVTDVMRRVAKVVNFGIVYGISEYGLSTDLKVSNKEAKKYIDDFYKIHSNIDKYMQDQIAFAKENGFVKTAGGRIRKINDINARSFILRSRAERMAQNMAIQGTAAEIIKIAMNKVEEKLSKSGLDAKLIMQVHDELVVECASGVEEKVKDILKAEMESAVKLKVPLTVSVNSGYRWGEIH